VRLVSRAGVHVSDIYVQNTPAVTTAHAIVTVRNESPVAVTRDLVTVVRPWHPDAAPATGTPAGSSATAERGSPVFRAVRERVTLPRGDTVVRVEMPVPRARPWSPDSPALYLCEVSLVDDGAATDRDERRFGFRWFGPDGIGRDAVFRLNGRRIVLRSAINWGFWPVNGIYPTREWARREIQAAKDLGLNMLNAHRTIPSPRLLEAADEMGLLIHEEPGAYASGDVDLAFTQKLMREKLMRMVRRDRSHPSLVIRNVINEAWGSVAGMRQRPEVWETRKRDLRDAHALDPSRVITHTSAWAPAPGVEDPSKMHMRPFDDTIHMSGWYDVHRAEGPETWNDGFYRSPADFYLHVENRGEIVFWGEEGAISTPSRIGSIARALETLPRPGWDGAVYREWFRVFDEFLARKRLRPFFPDVDALTTAMAAISLDHQGRKIENLRIGDQGDAYVVNGWESQITENHSGIVDAFRHPKADPALVRRFTEPLYVAVKVRGQVVPVGTGLVADFFLVNERDVRGPHTLDVVVRDASGGERARAAFPVTATGGDVHGEPLVSDVRLAGGARGGPGRIEARLLDASGAERARGHEDFLVVDWKGTSLHGAGAIWETRRPRVRGFLEGQQRLQVPAYDDRLGPLEWVVVARSPNEGVPGLVPADRLHQSAGAGAGLRATFHRGRNFEVEVHRRVDATVSLVHEEGATPDPSVPLTSGYSVRWEGEVVPLHTGTHGFVVEASGGVRLTVDGKTIIDSLAEWVPRVHQGVIDLEADRAVTLRLEFSQRSGASRCRLSWSQPERDLPDLDRLLDRVARDGTTLLLIDRADTWMDRIASAVGVTYTGAFRLGRNWLGGVHFVREHPLFADLPVNVGMGWPYQAVVRDGQARYGLLLEGEELVAGAWHSYPMTLGTAVGVIRHGAGRIIVSTLDIADNLEGGDGPSHVARKLLTNFLSFAENRARSH
jgi:hypothetical protein